MIEKMVADEIEKPDFIHELIDRPYCDADFVPTKYNRFIKYNGCYHSIPLWLQKIVNKRKKIYFEYKEKVFNATATEYEKIFRKIYIEGLSKILPT